MWEHKHLLENCPREPKASRDQPGSRRGGSNAPPTTHDQGRGHGALGQSRGSIVSETVNRRTTTIPA